MLLLPFLNLHAKTRSRELIRVDLSDLLRECKVLTAEQSSVDRIDSRPAVYAFYDLFRFSAASFADDIDRFKVKHARTLDLRTEAPKKRESYLPEYFRVYLRGDPERFKGEGLRLAEALDTAQLDSVSTLLLFLSFFNQPLYIGKTGNMHTRFIAHHDKDFLYSMKRDYQRDAGEFLLFIFYCPNEFVRLIESVLLQLVKPPFADQTT